MLPAVAPDSSTRSLQPTFAAASMSVARTAAEPVSSTRATASRICFDCALFLVSGMKPPPDVATLFRGMRLEQTHGLSGATRKPPGANQQVERILEERRLIALDRVA